jgi:hypothetical protein
MLPPNPAHYMEEKTCIAMLLTKADVMQRLQLIPEDVPQTTEPILIAMLLTKAIYLGCN